MRHVIRDILVALTSLGALVWLSRMHASTEASLLLVFGLGLFASFAAASLFSAMGLPRITVYLVMGIILGPFVLNVFSMEMVKDLSFVDTIALSLIALVAGGEIDFAGDRKKLWRVFVFVMVKSAVVVAVILPVLLLGRHFGVLPMLSSMAAVALLTVILNAKSPSTTVAVIVETGAKGVVADTVLTAAIVKDIIIIIVFAMVLSMTADGSHDTAVTAVIMEELISMAVGVFVGIGIIAYLRFVRRNEGVFILLATVALDMVLIELHLNPLLVFLLAGISVKNFSPYGHQFVKTVEDNSQVIYLVFFFVAGALIDLRALQALWAVGLVLVVVRAGAMAAGCWVGAKAIRGSRELANWSWTGFIGQAGVSIGFATIVAGAFPSWGNEFRSLVLAIVGVNQVIGPILFKYSLKMAGEIPAGKS